ncbi:Na(+)/H(+) antiporter subunit B [Sporosarcina pasteurii]|uniref:Multiple resistance and pH homeostasis protein B n=1 Tax=Sporosarcina pasteurii TaxID=1474 RepID=A0A380C986_SPOPA|nr:Na(+)/H(+) antiporter subunit B [Sporosarcina pasteurii]MDS9472792.1 Na(+)/H(+) antiporter subunit B [Sporosarcina pasteurii]QBQ04443.1 Na(+)/H(+) antiporter subunit B [Sporosarcina pasteurii]SUJ15042.1 Multiple resistance and pH homeostasis protein B [Sporosarcina pasteurii]
MKANDVILQTATKVVFFIIFLFSIHIFFAGHFAPGGGFVGGLLTTAAIVLLLLAFDLKTVQQALPFNFMIVVAIGLVLAIGMGAGSFVFNVPFLTHAFGDFYLPLFGVTSLHTAMIFDAGVYLVVVGSTVTMIQSIGGES